MNLINNLDNYTGLNITIGIDQLKEAIDYCITKTRQEFEQGSIEENSETYPTPDEVTRILGVSRSTLWRWARHNYLLPVEIGGKRRYRMSDIKKLLEKK